MLKVLNFKIFLPLLLMALNFYYLVYQYLIFFKIYNDLILNAMLLFHQINQILYLIMVFYRNF